MCLTCGCLEPHNPHGNKDHMLIEDLERSAKIDGLSLDDAVKNLVETVDVAKREKGHHHV